MTAMSAPAHTGTTTTRRLRAGLALSGVLGFANILFAFTPTPEGEPGPPVAVVVVGALLGLANVVCAVVAWRSGNRLAVRINAASLIINGLLAVPAFFVDVAPWIKLVVAISIVLTVLALVLTLRRERTPYTVSD